MPYVDWEYYSSLFTNISDEQEFNRLYKQAARVIDCNTHMRAQKFCNDYDEESATLFQKGIRDAISQTVCQLINNIRAQEASGMGTGITSVSNDGYSESYKITTAQEKEAQLRNIVQNGLRGTGLAGAICL